MFMNIAQVIGFHKLPGESTLQDGKLEIQRSFVIENRIPQIRNLILRVIPQKVGWIPLLSSHKYENSITPKYVLKQTQIKS